MAVRRLAPSDIQPASFEFSEENLVWANEQIAKFPKGRQASAVIPLLWRAQEQYGWLPEPAIRVVAEFLDMPYIRVLEVATFYTMFNLEPVGKYFVQLCGTTPCMLRGAEDLKAVCREVIGDENTISEDGMLSWLEVECLGACVNAPMVQINKDYYEDLTSESFRELLNKLKKDEDVKPGPQIDRQFSAPSGGPTTLKAYAYAQVTDKSPSERVTALSENVKTKEKPTKPAKKTSVSHKKVEEISNGDGVKPKGLEAPINNIPDDLKMISGVGPKLEGLLHSVGIYHFHQIAEWTKDEVEWMDGFLSFKGRIERDKWIEQAKEFAKSNDK